MSLPLDDVASKGLVLHHGFFTAAGINVLVVCQGGPTGLV